MLSRNFGRVLIDWERKKLHHSMSFSNPAASHQRARSGTSGTKKQYVCLFTCLLWTKSGRHAGVIFGLDTDFFLNFFHRTVNFSRRPLESFGHRRKFCQYRQNVSPARKETQDGEKNSKVHANEETKWHFSPSSEPHVGGVHEIAIKVVKRPRQFTSS